MRSYEFLPEAVTAIDTGPRLEEIATIANTIIRDCQPFIRANKNELQNRYYLYRGIHNPNHDSFISGDVREDRMPKDMPARWHNLLNNYFRREFGWPYRSASMFASPSRIGVLAYGETYVVFPAGDYEICFSALVDDFYEDVATGGSYTREKILKTIPTTVIKKIREETGLEVYDRIDLLNLFVLFDENQLDESKFAYFLDNYFLPRCNYAETKYIRDLPSVECMVKCDHFYGITWDRYAAKDLVSIIEMIIQ